MRDARRAADGARGLAASPPRTGGGAGAPLLPGGEAGGAVDPPGATRGKRCLPPPMPSRETYAAALEEQIAAREAARQAGKTSPVLGPPGPAAIMLEQPEKATGRRLVGPMESHVKDAYAAELQEQMVARSLRRATDRALSQEPSGGGLEAGLAGADWQWRGRRPAAEIGVASKEALTRALQEQIAGRAAEKAATAFHLQEPLGTGPVPDWPTKGKRKAAASAPPPSREAYAAALRDQICEQRGQRAARVAEHLTGATVGAFGGGASSGGGGGTREASPAARGRRHASQIELPSKHALGSALREQMAERNAPWPGQVSELAHQDAGDPTAAANSCSSASTPPWAIGGAGCGPRQQSQTLQPTLEETREPAPQELARYPPDMLEVTVPPPEALAASASRLGRSGACVIGAASGGGAGGLSATEVRRIRFADECAAAPGGGERTLSARRGLVDERAEELRRLLDGGGGPDAGLR